MISLIPSITIRYMLPFLTSKFLCRLTRQLQFSLLLLYIGSNKWAGPHGLELSLLRLICTHHHTSRCHHFNQWLTRSELSTGLNNVMVPPNYKRSTTKDLSINFKDIWNPEHELMMQLTTQGVWYHSRGAHLRGSHRRSFFQCFLHWLFIPLRHPDV